MSNKYDLKTFFVADSQVGKTSYVTNVGGGVIPTGKTRFLTYIRVERLTVAQADQPVSAIGIGVLSYTTNATTVTSYSSFAATDEKIRLDIAQVTGATAGVIDESLFRTEVKGSMEQPILSVAGGNFMVLGVRVSGPTAAVFGQYYDE